MGRRASPTWKEGISDRTTKTVGKIEQGRGSSVFAGVGASPHVSLGGKEEERRRSAQGDGKMAGGGKTREGSKGCDNHPQRKGLNIQGRGKSRQKIGLKRL